MQFREPTEGEQLLYDRIVMLEAEYNKERDRADKLAQEVEQLKQTVVNYQADVANNYKLMALYQEQRDLWMDEANRGMGFMEDEHGS